LNVKQDKIYKVVVKPVKVENCCSEVHSDSFYAHLETPIHQCWDWQCSWV